MSDATTPSLDTKFVSDEKVFPPPDRPNPKIALSPPYAAAAKLYLAVPTPDVSVATTPELETRFDIAVLSPALDDVAPKAKIALSPPYAAAPPPCLVVPTPVVSEATTPLFEDSFLCKYHR